MRRSFLRLAALAAATALAAGLASSAAAYGGYASARGTVTAGQPLALDLAGHASNLDLRNLPAQVLHAPRSCGTAP